ncbi:hypothetical protein GCM10028803_46190 [Larkinella knui]
MDEATLRKMFEPPASVNVGIICGNVSGGLEVIDVDCKYDLTGKLMQDLMSSIEGALPTIAAKLVMVKTPSGGYHLYYRCSQIEGNKKLAQRLPVESETKEKRLVLIETRGEGGFIVAPPSTNYQLISGSFDTIPTITPDQRNTLIAIARSFDMMPDEEQYPERLPVRNSEFFEQNDDSPFAAYNQRGDVVALLEQHDWKFVKRQGDRIHLKRPGKSDAETSGNFHEGKRKLYVFSSSTAFEPQVAYSPSDVFILLECSGDKKIAARRLAEIGFGQISTRRKLDTLPTQVKADRIRVEGVSINAEVINLVSSTQTIKIENVKSADLDNIYIYFTDISAEKEVLQTIEALEAWTDARIYIRQVQDINSNEGESVRPYEFILNRLLRHYAELYNKNGGYLTAEQEDRFFVAVHDAGAKIKDPHDRERYRLLLLAFSEENRLGITSEIYQEITERIRFDRALEAQNEEMSALLDRVRAKQEIGDTNGALVDLTKGIQEIKSRTSKDNYANLLVPTTEKDFAERLKLKPDSLNTGLTINGEELQFPAGAISLICAPTNHGKTTLLLNALLNVSKQNSEKSFYLFSFEEDSDSILITALSIDIDHSISKNNRASIRSYYRDDQHGIEWVGKYNRETFEVARRNFFESLIDTGRVAIKYVEYGSEALADAIRYVAKYGNAGGVFIDYVQLINKEGFKAGTRAEELKRVCLDLKNAAVDTGLPVVLGAQFNRTVTSPLRLHPTQIADASDIEKIANCIVGFWNLAKKPMGTKEDLDAAAALAQYGDVYAEILKFRGGKTTGMGQGESWTFDGNTGVIRNRVVQVTGQSPHPILPKVQLVPKVTSDDDDDDGPGF